MKRLILVTLCLALWAPAAAMAGPLTAYGNAQWWTGAGFEGGERFVRDGLFVAASGARPDHRIDLHGAYVTPPYADAHNHMPGPPEAVSATATRAGVFYLMNPTIMASTAPALRRALVGTGKVEAVLSMGAVTAPGGHPEPLYVDILRPRVYPNVPPDKFLGDAFHYVTRTSDIAPVLDRLQAQGAQFVKIMVLNSEEFAERHDDPARRGHSGLDPALVQPLVAEAHRRGLRVAAHIETAADFRVIVAAGVDEAAHMPGYYGDEGPPGRYAITEADAAAAAKAHIVVVATASLAADNNQGRPERLARVRAVQRDNLERLKTADVPLLIGTDGEPDDALKEAAYLKDLGVFTPTEAVKALTETTPRWIFPGRRIGALSPGFEASFLVLGGDPTRSLDQAANILRRVKNGVAFAPPPAKPTLAVTHVNVVPMDRPGVLKDQTLLIAGSRIVAMRRGLKPPAGVKVVDGKGRYAVPGLWDMHVHVLTGYEPDKAAQALRAMLAGGVTGVRDMGSTLGQLQAFKAARLAGGPPLPDLVGAGPVINGPATPWSRPIEAHAGDPAAGRKIVAAELAAGSDFIKPYGGLDPQTYAAVASAARGAGVALGGHLPLSIDLQTALAAGQRSVEHAEVHLSKSCGATPAAKAGGQWISAYAERGLTGRDEVELALRAGRDPARCRALLSEMARAQVWWTPTLTLDFADGSFIDEAFRRTAAPGSEAACREGAAMIAHTPVALRQQALDGELADVAAANRAGVQILAGTDMPSPCEAPLASLHRELQLLQKAGLSPFAALRTATVEPARYLGREDAGTLGVGKIADIVLVDRDPLRDLGALGSASLVILHGSVVR